MKSQNNPVFQLRNPFNIPVRISNQDRNEEMSIVPDDKV